MARKSAAKTQATRARRARVAPVPEPLAPAPAPAAKKAVMGKKLLLVIGLVLVAAMGVQAYLVMKSNIKRYVDFELVNPVLHMGRDEAGAVWSEQALAVTRQGNLVCLGEAGTAFQIVQPDGKVLAYHPLSNKGPEGDMTNGVDVAVDSQGLVYVMVKPNTVKVFDAKLKFVRSMALNTKGAVGIAINSKDQLLVADMEDAKLFFYDLKGNLVKQTDGGKIKLAAPYRLALNAKDEIFVLDVARGWENPMDVKVYSPAGEPIRKWTVRNFNSNLKAGIAWHPKGYILLNESSNGSQGYGFYIYKENGDFVANCIGTNDKMNLAHLFPSAIDPRNGDIYVQNQWIQRGVDRLRWTPQEVK
jgi:hypothetical protein